MTQGYKMTTSTHSARRARTRYEKHNAHLLRQSAIMDFDYQSSLSRRLHAERSLYSEACASMDLEQVNRVVVPGVLPIAFSLGVKPSTFSDVIVTLPEAPRSPRRFRRAWAAKSESPAVTPLNAGSISTRCVTWVKSSTPEHSSAFRG